jgi:hypothetical protein
VSTVKKIGATLVCIVGIASCSSPSEPTSIVDGIITEMTTSPLRILVESPAQDCGYRLLVDSQTEIQVQTGTGTPVRSDSSQLNVGAAVIAWADGDLLLICPALGRAARVVVRN